MDLKVVPLHKHPKYLSKCCALINEEWKRSETARLRSLESSCDFLPVNLILLKNDEIIGHLKLSKIPSIEESCFVESVVIEQKLRGLGYGTYLMKEAENYCYNNLHLKSIHLSTKGQEKFYSKLGYVECEPVNIYGSFVSRQSQRSTEKTAFIAPKAPALPNNNIISTTPKTYMYKRLQNNCT